MGSLVAVVPVSVPVQLLLAILGVYAVTIGLPRVLPLFNAECRHHVLPAAPPLLGNTSTACDTAGSRTTSWRRTSAPRSTPPRVPGTCAPSTRAASRDRSCRGCWTPRQTPAGSSALSCTATGAATHLSASTCCFTGRSQSLATRWVNVLHLHTVAFLTLTPR